MLFSYCAALLITSEGKYRSALFTSFPKISYFDIISKIFIEKGIR